MTTETHMMEDIQNILPPEADVREPLHVFVVAGEASGDLLGANLMRALKSIRPDTHFHGVGGKQAFSPWKNCPSWAWPRYYHVCLKS